MIKSTTTSRLCLSALAITWAMAAIDSQPAAAQTARNLVCNGCVNSKDIRDRGIKARDLAPGVVFGATIFVRSNAGSQAANCDELRDALDAIEDASANNPVLVKLERGAYDCGSEPIALKPFVTIEGAGRNFSTIIGEVSDSFDEGVVTGADDAALRHLTVENRAAGSGVAIAINTAGSQMSLTDVAVKLDSATVSQGYGIFAEGGSLELSNVSVQTSAANGQSQGILGQSGAELDMMNTWVHNQSGAFGNPAALELRDSSVTGFGILFSSNFFGLLGRGNSTFELVDGTVIGGRGAASSFTGSFTCIGIADEDFTARAADCS
jgi:hypothetical protein